jgi:hypothetical protein
MTKSYKRKRKLFSKRRGLNEKGVKEGEKMLDCKTSVNCLGEAKMQIRLTEGQLIDIMDMLGRSNGRPMKTLTQILTCKEILEDKEAQGIIDEIIGLLRSKHITYACAYNILNGVMDALTEFSRQLPM